jgi:outer membrane protein assembly factor BamB
LKLKFDKMKNSEKDIRVVKNISLISGLFTLFVAFTMIFSLIQLKTIKPLDNPALIFVKEQYDKDPVNRDKAEQVRAMDLMARKAYFSSRWQVETGSYLLLAGAIVFIFCQRIIAGNEKLVPAFPSEKPDNAFKKSKTRYFLIITSSSIVVIAIVSSFILRTSLPAPLPFSVEPGQKATESVRQVVIEEDINNYPFFGGHGSRGIVKGSDYPTEWNGTEGKNIKWKIKIPGQGKSSPVIWGDRVYLTGAKGTSCEIYSIDKNSGKIIWTKTANKISGEPSAPPKTDADAGLAVSTIATDGTSICAIFSNGNLICLDKNGEQKWVKNIGVPENTYGYSSSLLIFQNILIVQFDSDVKVSIIGLDLKTGNQIWETPRQGRPVWSSPVMAVFEGKTQIVVNGFPFVSGYDPLTGKELWSVNCMSGDVAPSVAVNNKFVFAVTDYAKLVAIKPGINASIVWEDNSFTPDVSSPVASEKYLFLSTGNADAACYDAEKGDTIWWSHIFDNPFYASPVICDEKVWFLDRTGIMHIVKAESIFNLVATSPLGENTDCTPAFSEKKIYIRGKENLYCISKN